MIVVGQIVAQRGEPADGVQTGAGERHARSECVARRFDPAGDHHLRHERSVDHQGFDQRRQRTARPAAIHAACDPGGGQRRDDAAQIFRPDRYVAVGDDEVVVLHRGHQAVQGADLGIAAERLRSDDQPNVTVGEIALQPPDDTHRGVVRLAHAAHELEDRIVEPAEAGQIVVQVGLDALERFEDGDGRQGFGFGVAPRGRPEEPPCRQYAEEVIEQRDQQQAGHSPRCDHGTGTSTGNSMKNDLKMASIGNCVRENPASVATSLDKLNTLQAQRTEGWAGR